MQTVDKISGFFSNSPKRQLALEEWIDNVLPEENRMKLKVLCRTRWVERHEALNFEVFIDPFSQLAVVLKLLTTVHHQIGTGTHALMPNHLGLRDEIDFTD